MLMRDIRMAGFKYYAGQQQIRDFAAATSGECSPSGVILPKLSYLYFETGYDNPRQSHNPVVIRKNTLGREAISSDATSGTDPCCDQIQIVYDDFNQNEIFQPFKRYRITYYAKPNDAGSYAVWKRIESYIKERTDCRFTTDLSDDLSDSQKIALLRGTWEDTPREGPGGRRICAECTPGVLIRDHVEDMEFIPFDSNGRVIQQGNKFPAPDTGIPTSLRERMYDIRGVDIKITFKSKKNFFKKSESRTISGLSGRDLTKQDKYLRDSVIVSVHTRNIGGQDFR